MKINQNKRKETTDTHGSKKKELLRMKNVEYGEKVNIKNEKREHRKESKKFIKM